MMNPVFKKWCLAFCASALLPTLSACSADSANPQAQVTAEQASSAAAHHSMPVGKLFDLSQVRITDGPFAHAMHTNVSYLLAMEPDRLLAPYLREAGLTPKEDSYGNWENSGLDGHIGGHYLSALSLAYASTGDEALLQRLQYMLNELHRAQQATGGYLGGIPNSQAMWAQIKAGEIKADLFSLNDRWVPLYNIDKIFHGLRDAYEIAHQPLAKAMLSSLGEWILDTTANLTDEQFQQMLYSEHGGLNEVFADMAAIFNDPRYLKLGQQFTHQKIIQPLIAGQDQLTGLHANTQIPKIIGALRVAELNDDAAWEKAATFFWDTVSQHRSVSMGGNSVREHFHDDNDFTPMVEDIEGPETCNTYNMMKLSKMLFLRTGDARYLDFYERATYNHILSSQHPQHGGLVYFTSMRPGHYRMYSSVHDSMWCCVGSGIENHSKYGELAFTHSNDELWVNLFMPASLHWPETGVTVTQRTAFPDNNAVILTVNTERDDTPFTLNLRQPGWSQGEIAISVNGQPVNGALTNGYWQVTRDWNTGDTVTFKLNPTLTTEQLPDGQDYYSVMYGPVVMATPVTAFENETLNFVADDSRMGHIAAGPVCPPEALPIMLGEPDAFLQQLQRPDPTSLSFVASGNVAIANPVDQNAVTRLIPFFRLHDARYQVYWPQMPETAFDDYVKSANAKAAELAALKAMTVDAITPGEQQPEVEHDFRGEQTRAGVNNGMHWRDATGFFEYRLSNKALEAGVLRITYFKGDVGRQFSISLNNELLADVSLPVGEPETDFYSVDYPLSPAMRKANVLTLRFSAASGSVAGGIYGIRLLKDPN